MSRESPVRRSSDSAGSPRRSAARWLVVAAVVLAGGCGSDLPQVTGSVTYRGQPVAEGKVVFHPIGIGVVGYGALQSDGTFAVQTGSAAGLPEGDYKVTVVATRVTPSSQPGGVPTFEHLIPERYGRAQDTDLQVKVTADGENDFPLELKDE
jgi:hypothetical protein